MSLWIRNKFYDGNYFNRLLLACKIIGVIKIDWGPCHLSIQRGWNSENYTKNYGKKSQHMSFWVRDKFYDKN